MTIAQTMTLGAGAQASLTRHRERGHAARSINQAILTAGASGALAPIAAVAISDKAERLSKLQELLDVCMHHVRDQHKANKIDHRLISATAGLLRQGAEEMGEWRPDGGRAAEAATKLAQSIVIHAATSAAISGRATHDSSQSRECIDAPVIDV